MWLVGEMDDMKRKFHQGLVKCMGKMKIEHLIQNLSLTSLSLRSTCLVIIRLSIIQNCEIVDDEI